MPRAKGKDHRGCLIARHRRGAYAQAVTDWLERVLPFYARGNVKQEGGRYVAQDDCPPHFEYDSGEYRWSFQPGKPSDVLLLKRGDFQAARRQLFDIALNLLREGRPCDQRALRQRIRDEGLN